MYIAWYDKTKNHIHICIKGEICGNQFKRYVCDIKELIDVASEGFTVCADISHAERWVLENSDAFQSIRDYAKIKGMREAVTIIDTDKLNFYMNKSNLNLFFTIKDAYKYLYGLWDS